MSWGRKELEPPASSPAPAYPPMCWLNMAPCSAPFPHVPVITHTWGVIELAQSLTQSDRKSHPVLVLLTVRIRVIRLVFVFYIPNSCSSCSCSIVVFFIIIVTFGFAGYTTFFLDSQ